MNRFQFSLPAFVYCFSFINCQLLKVTPPGAQLVPENSQENVSYLCNVTRGNAGVQLDLEAVWAVEGAQLSTDIRRRAFAASGVFVTDLGPGVAMVTVSAAGRASFNGSVVVQCFGTVFTSPPLTVSGAAVAVLNFGECRYYLRVC